MNFELASDFDDKYLLATDEIDVGKHLARVSDVSSEK
jgi:hypothetical protein